MTKKLVFGSMGAAGIVALASICDMAVGFPFAKYSMLMDILYLLASGVVLYLGYETYREIR